VSVRDKCDHFIFSLNSTVSLIRVLPNEFSSGLTFSNYRGIY